jgi:hypothetical protein
MTEVRMTRVLFGFCLLVGCSSPSSTTSPSGSSSGAGSSGSTSSATSGAAQASGSGTGDASTASTGASSSAAVDASTSDTSSATPEAGSAFPAKPSPGCFKSSTWTAATGTFVAQPPGCDGQPLDGGAPFDPSVCQAIPPDSTPPATPGAGDAEYRGWWTLVPNGYVVDPSKPYKVIYSANGCPGFVYSAGDNIYAYDKADGDGAIQVGLDLDTFSERSGCYDTRNPSSNDLAFLPWLMAHIEDELCVDMSHEFFSTYADDASMMQQLNCAFPDKLRGSVSVAGFEPGAAGKPGSLPTCVSKPTAAFFVHDMNDTETSYASILPGCSRVLQQNGCTSTQCDPLDSTLTSPYMVPSGVKLPPGATCQQFNGCPDDYPVVFCITTNQGHGDGQTWGAANLFWDWMNNRLN